MRKNNEKEMQLPEIESLLEIIWEVLTSGQKESEECQEVTA